LGAGTYTTNFSIPAGKEFEIIGAGADTVLQGQIATTSSTAGTIILKNLTINVDENIVDSTGISQTGKSAIAIWGNQTVICENVTFNMTLANSTAITSWWDTGVGTTIIVRNCTFNCNGQRPIRATGNVTGRLSPAVEVDQGIHGSGTFLIGTPLWNAESVSHDNMGMGAEMAMRMGIRITPVNASGETTGEKSKFFIYEPNADVHADGTEGYVPTHSVTGRENLISDKFLIRQTVSTWTETDPAQRDVVVKNLGNFMDDTTLFLLDSGEMVRLDVYIWLEGQDQDCMQTIHEAQVMACLQFDADPDNQSGLQPIE
jgi:hypothetical protein